MTVTGTRLDDALAANPAAPIAIPTTATGINLTSMGVMLGVGDDGATYTVWRLRNGTADTITGATLRAHDGPVVFTGDLAAHTDTFVASPVVSGPATHVLAWAGGQLVKAAGTHAFVYDYILPL